MEIGIEPLTRLREYHVLRVIREREVRTPRGVLEPQSREGIGGGYEYQRIKARGGMITSGRELGHVAFMIVVCRLQDGACGGNERQWQNRA